jgi:hypothetical protein
MTVHLCHWTNAKNWSKISFISEPKTRARGILETALYSVGGAIRVIPLCT